MTFYIQSDSLTANNSQDRANTEAVAILSPQLFRFAVIRKGQEWKNRHKKKENWILEGGQLYFLLFFIFILENFLLKCFQDICFEICVSDWVHSSGVVYLFACPFHQTETQLPTHEKTHFLIPLSIGNFPLQLQSIHKRLYNWLGEKNNKVAHAVRGIEVVGMSHRSLVANLVNRYM